MTDNYVKILVYTEPEDGYPPEEWESLWGIPMGADRFKIDNIPFYAKDLSCDDVVEATLEGKDYIFKKILIPSDNSTIRVLIYDIQIESSVRAKLLNLGCSIEGTGTAGHFAVNVPKGSVTFVIKFLEESFEGELLDFEEGALR